MIKKNLSLENNPSRNTVLIQDSPELQSSFPEVRKGYLIPFSAKSWNSLKSKFEDMLCWLEDDAKEYSIGDIAFTLQVGRSHFILRSAFVVHSVDDLKQKLTDVLKTGAADDFVTVMENETPVNLESNEIEDGDGLLNEIKLYHKYSAVEYCEKLLHIASLYVKGYDPCWESFYQEAEFRRIPMPTYPFEREFYMAVECQTDINAYENVEAKESMLHPLVGCNISTLAEQVYITRFTGCEFFFRDHCVRGQRVFPGAAYIEMARAVGELASGRKISKVKDIIWLRPIIAVDAQTEVYISLYPADAVIEYEIYSLEGDQRKVNSTGKLVYEDSDTLKEIVMDIDLLKSRCTGILKGIDCYSLFRSAGLEYKDSFQVISEINIGNNELLAQLVIPSSLMTNFTDFELHPSMLDGALQAVIGLTDSGEQKNTLLYLPFSVDELEIKLPLVQQCYAYAKAVDDNSNGRISNRKFDIYILDYMGRILVSIRNFTVKEYKSEIKSEGLDIFSKLKSGEISEEDIVQLLGGVE